MKSKLLHAGAWSVAALQPPRRLCYHPAVFFCHVGLFLLSFPQEKCGAPSKYVISCFPFFNCANLKLRNLKIAYIAASLCSYTIPSCSSQIRRCLARKCLQHCRSINRAAYEPLSCSFTREKGEKILFCVSLLPKRKNLIVFCLFAVAVILGCLSQLYFVVQNVRVAGGLCLSGE